MPLGPSISENIHELSAAHHGDPAWPHRRIVAAALNGARAARRHRGRAERIAPHVVNVDEYVVDELDAERAFFIDRRGRLIGPPPFVDRLAEHATFAERLVGPGPYAEEYDYGDQGALITLIRGEGWVRIVHSGMLFVEIGAPPTTAQLRTLGRLIRNAGQASIDVWKRTLPTPMLSGAIIHSPGELREVLVREGMLADAQQAGRRSIRPELVLASTFVDSTDVPPADIIAKMIDQRERAIVYDTGNQPRRNKVNAALQRELGQLLALRSMRRSLDASGGDPFVLFDDIAEDADLAGHALELRDQADMRARVQNQPGLRRDLESTGFADVPLDALRAYEQTLRDALASAVLEDRDSTADGEAAGQTIEYDEDGMLALLDEPEPAAGKPRRRRTAAAIEAPAAEPEPVHLRAITIAEEAANDPTVPAERRIAVFERELVAALDPEASPLDRARRLMDDARADRDRVQLAYVRAPSRESRIAVEDATGRYEEAASAYDVARRDRLAQG